MNTIRFKTKEAFVAALEDRRKFWHDFDRRQTREHEAAERKWLTDARARMREAVKWDYATLKENLTWNGSLPLGDAPKCPRLMEPKIDTVLAALQWTQGKAFTVDTSGAWREAHTLLTWDPDARETAC